MPSPAAAYKTAQEIALRASTDLLAAMETGTGKVRLYTEVPTDALLPYVVVGADQIILENTDCGAEAEVISTVSLWSLPDPPDRGAQARAMGAAIIDALNGPLTVTGWTVDEWEVQSESYSTDPDQSTHGALVIRHLLSEQVA